MKKVISIVLTAALIFSVCAAAANASTTKTACGGECENCPTIVVPGIGQSNVWLLDEKGEYVLDEDNDKVGCFPGYFPVMPIVKIALIPVLFSLLLQRNIGLNKAVDKIVELGFGMNMSDNNGKESKLIEVEKYTYSLAECNEYERNEIYRNVPIQGLADYIGEDHIYYFAYNSFGNNIAIVDELYQFIQQVKQETGHNKVNLVPISLGGTIANGLLEYYPNVYQELNKVIYIVPALDGSSIVGDVYKKDLTFLDKEQLYHSFLERLMEESQAKLIEIAFRLFPDEVLMSFLDYTVDALISKVLVNCTNMWALIPSKDYPELAQKLLSSPEKAEIKKQTDRYYSAQVNSDKNIKKLVDNGIKVFNIVDYDFPLYNVGNSWNDGNADGVIHLDSTSMGAYAARVGETLPESYAQKNTVCQNPEHNHISPDRVVDASTGMLPDTTFYFDGQGHEGTGRNDVIMTLAIALLKDDAIENVYSDPSFPQFNIGRETKNLINSDLPNAKSSLEKINSGELKATAEQKARLESAISAAEEMLARTVCVAGEAEQIEEDLESCLRELGVYGAEKEDSTFGFAFGINSFVDKLFGTNGFSELPIVLFTRLISLIKGK